MKKFSIAFCLSFVGSLSASEDNNQFKDAIDYIFDPDLISNNITPILEPIFWIFTAFSFLLFLCYGFSAFSKDSPVKDKLDSVIKICIGVSIIASVAVMKPMLVDAGESLASATGLAGMDAVTGKFWDYADEWSIPGSPVTNALNDVNVDGNGDPSLAAADGEEADAGVWASVKKSVGELGESLRNGYNSMVSIAKTGVQFIVVRFLWLVAVVALFFGGILMKLALIVQRLLIDVGFSMLPLMIGGLYVPALQAAAKNYILGLISLCLWPLAWALANIGTIAIISAISSWVSGITAAILPAVGVGNALQVPSVGVALGHMGWATILILMAASLGLIVWVLVSTFLAPWGFHRMLTSGSSFMGQMVQSAMQGTAVAAGSTAAVAGTVATAGGGAPLAAAIKGMGAKMGGTLATKASSSMASMVTSKSFQSMMGATKMAGGFASKVGHLTPDRGSTLGQEVGSMLTGNTMRGMYGDAARQKALEKRLMDSAKGGNS